MSSKDLTKLIKLVKEAQLAAKEFRKLDPAKQRTYFTMAAHEGNSRVTEIFKIILKYDKN